jgi:hypothetical protein
MARSERFELPALGIEIRCSIQLSYERVPVEIAETAGDFYPRTSKEGSSEAGMQSAVLADIVGGALVAVVGGGAVIIGESAGLVRGAVIVGIADRVGQPVVVIVVAVIVPMMAAGLCETRREGDRGQHDGGSEKL